jgi:hypothetical protein
MSRISDEPPTKQGKARAGTGQWKQGRWCARRGGAGVHSGAHTRIVRGLVRVCAEARRRCVTVHTCSLEAAGSHSSGAHRDNGGPRRPGRGRRCGRSLVYWHRQRGDASVARIRPQQPDPRCQRGARWHCCHGQSAIGWEVSCTAHPPRVHSSTGGALGNHRASARGGDQRQTGEVVARKAEVVAWVAEAGGACGLEAEELGESRVGRAGVGHQAPSQAGYVCDKRERAKLEPERRTSAARRASFAGTRSRAP